MVDQQKELKEPDNKFPLVTILIITWNRKKDVLETVQSIYEQAYRNFEIIVVDNGSNDDTVDTLCHAYPGVKIVPLDRNMGVSDGRNAGIAIAQGEIIFCLDSDASPGRDTLNNLVRKFQTEPRVGVINSKIVNAYTKTLDGGPGWVYSLKQKVQQYKEFLSFSFSEGGAAIRKEVFDRVGLFWEFLFFGYEGQEFSLRVWDASYKILYYPEAIVYHRSSPNARSNEKDRDCSNMMNSLCIYFVRYPWWMFFLLAPLKFGAVFLRGARRGYLRQVIRALLDFMRAIQTVATQMPRFLVLGQRTDIDIREPWDFDAADWEAGFRRLLAQKGALHAPSGIDFFVFREECIQMYLHLQ